MFGKPSARRAIAVGAVLLALATACSRGDAAQTAVSDSAQATPAPVRLRWRPMRPRRRCRPLRLPHMTSAAVSKLIDDAIAAQRLPGAVVLIGHGGKVVFRQAYGERKLAGSRDWMDRPHLQSR